MPCAKETSWALCAAVVVPALADEDAELWPSCPLLALSLSLPQAARTRVAVTAVAARVARRVRVRVLRMRELLLWERDLDVPRRTASLSSGRGGARCLDPQELEFRQGRWGAGAVRGRSRVRAHGVGTYRYGYRVGNEGRQCRPVGHCT
jgi:hypothetical protein